jgi:hypothetical protein
MNFAIISWCAKWLWRIVRLPYDFVPGNGCIEKGTVCFVMIINLFIGVGVGMTLARILKEPR